MPLNARSVFAMEPLPPVWQGRRRGTMALLIVVGVAAGAIAMCAGLLMSSLTTTGARPLPTPVTIVLLVVAGVSLGALRVAETTLAERLGQQYVGEVRRLLVLDALGPTRSPNVGITIARATNDLAAIRNWVALGIAPLLVGLPLVGGVLIALFLISPATGLGIASCLVTLGTVLVVLSPSAFRRYRAMRKKRGRMASFVADAARAAPSIHASGGTSRELKTVDKLSDQVQEAAVATAVTTGAMRGAAASTTTIMMLIATAVSLTGTLSTGELTTVMLLVAIMTTPVTDVGRIAEYRQGFNAARVVLGPVMERAHMLRRSTRQAKKATSRRCAISEVTSGKVHIGGVTKLPELVADAGARIAVQTDDPRDVETLLATFFGHRTEAYIAIGSSEINLTDGQVRRATVGVATADMELEQGTISRAIRYRRPSSKQAIGPLLSALGLADAVAAFPQGERTKLRRGGEPLTPPLRMLAIVARALYDSPPILVLHDISTRLSSCHVHHVRHALQQYPGIVLVIDEDWETIVPGATLWKADTGQRVVLAHPPAA